MTKQERTTAKRQIPRMVLIAAIVVLVLAGTALAAAVPGIRQWFSQQWTKETGRPIHTDQLGLIDQLSDAVGVSAQSGGVTVTVDSVTRGEDVIWFLLRYDGLPPEEELEEAFNTLAESQPEEDFKKEEYHIDGMEITVGVTSNAESVPAIGPRGYFFDSRTISFDPAVSDPDQGYYWETEQDELRVDGSRMLLLKHRITPIESASLQDALDVTLELSDLNWGVFRSTAVPVAEGTFTLNFSLPAIKPAKPLRTGSGTALGQLTFEYWDTDTMGPPPMEEMAFRDIRATPTGLTVYWADREQTERLYTIGDWYLIMKDGTEVRVDTNGTMYSDLPGGEIVSRYLWPVPLELRQATSLEYRYEEEVQSFELK